MKVTRSTPALDKLEKILGGINGKWTIDPRVSAENADKLAWLAARGRPFLAVTPALEASVVRFVAAELSFEPSASASKILRAAAVGAKAQVVLRFAHGGNDVTLRPLTARYLARKVARGLDRRIGVATAALLNDLSRSVWTITKG